jgi:hypothetical protein
MTETKEKIEDGGYYAIKGFTFQFDKSLLEVLANQESDVEIEQIQDIGVDNYYIQVKYKEAKTYSPSKVKDPMVRLLKCFIGDKSKKFHLYCYFSDKSPERVELTTEELDQILGTKKDCFTQDDKKAFIACFVLEFSGNFEQQFEELIKKIKNCFQLRSEKEAALYHGILRATLLELAINKDKIQRTINFQKAKELIAKKEKIIFESAYSKYLSYEQYLDHLKKELFTFKKANTPCLQRLFVIDMDALIRDSEIIEMINNISCRFFIKETSPAPYICLIGLDNKRLVTIKQKLWDAKLFFIDGTNFNGDRFRISDLLSDNYKDHNSNAKFKFLSIVELSDLLKAEELDDIFVFITSGNIDCVSIENSVGICIENTSDITKIIQ